MVAMEGVGCSCAERGYRVMMFFTPCTDAMVVKGWWWVERAGLSHAFIVSEFHELCSMPKVVFHLVCRGALICSQRTTGAPEDVGSLLFLARLGARRVRYLKVSNESLDILKETTTRRHHLDVVTDDRKCHILLFPGEVEELGNVFGEAHPSGDREGRARKVAETSTPAIHGGDEVDKERCVSGDDVCGVDLGGKVMG
jgi:hypothetical protein